jgi:hypothetical protein
MSLADQRSSHRAIEGLIATYAEFVDCGAFEAVGLLLANAILMGGAGSMSGRDAIAEMLRDNVIFYEDETPRTKHLITNGEPGALFFARQAEGRPSPCGLRGPA